MWLSILFLCWLLDYTLARQVLYPAVVLGGEYHKARTVPAPIKAGEILINQAGSVTKPQFWTLIVATPVGQQTIKVTSKQWELAKKGQHLTVRGQEGYFTGWQYTGQFVTQAEAQ